MTGRVNPDPPLVGLVCYGRAKNPDWYTLPIAYVESLRRAGGRPLLIPPGEGEIEPYLDVFDAFVLAGGGDIDPQHFGQAPHPTLSGVDPERDLTELLLTRRLIQKRVPLLAICRGIQILNVALGGDLIQHVPDTAGSKEVHLSTDGGTAMHSVHAAPESLVTRICGRRSLDVASKHHQAVGRLGSGLMAVAWTADGLVEAIELLDHPEVLGVQWHPEVTAREDVAQQSLFNWLVQMARRGQRPV